MFITIIPIYLYLIKFNNFKIIFKVRLCTALNKRCLEIINQEPNLSISQLNSLYRGYNHRYNVKEPRLFYKILEG